MSIMPSLNILLPASRPSLDMMSLYILPKVEIPTDSQTPSAAPIPKPFIILNNSD